MVKIWMSDGMKVCEITDVSDETTFLAKVEKDNINLYHELRDTMALVGTEDGEFVGPTTYEAWLEFEEVEFVLFRDPFCH